MYKMVKNKYGGNKGKRGARRRAHGSDKSNKIRIKQENGEHYAKITNMYGNAAEILCDDGVIRLLTWRQKFKGRNKKDNHIIINGVVLAGARSWEVVAPGKKPKADLIFVYSKNHIFELYKKKDIPRQLFPDGIEGDIAMRGHTENIDVEIEEDEAPVENKVIQHDVSLAEMMDDI